ncbi:MAG: hypothetical protein D6705_01940 [Deltaproteobacteria bacterium]|nr:MAG: hypothetical protein D6705_01940 [Deltaproteobacteria bacterium]
MRTITTRLLALAVVAAPGTVTAGGTRVLEIRDRDDFDKGEFDGAALSSMGYVTQGYASEIAKIDTAEGTFACATDGTRAIVGTLQPAALLEVRGRGKRGTPDTRSIAALPGVVTSAIAPLGDGTVLAATLPGATIHRVDRKGRLKPFAKLDAEFIWALAVEGGRVYAATGPSGKLFSLDRSGGDVRVEIDSEEEHLLSMAVVGGRIVVGTAPRAKLLAVGEPAEGVVLRDFDGDEVRALQVTGRYLVAAVNDFDTKGVATADALEKAVGRASLAGNDATGSVNLTKRDKGASFEIHAVDLGRKLDPDRAADAAWTRWFDAKGGYATGLSVDTRDGGVLVATSKKGKIYRLRGPRDVSVVADLDQAVVTSICRVDRGNVFATTSGGAAVARLFAGPAMDAVYTSHVLDAKQPARFGTLLVEGTGPFRVRVRTGPAKEPDARWSPWRDVPLSARADGMAGSLAGVGERRFLQVEVRVAGPAAKLRGLRVFHAPENLPPLVESITVDLPEPDEDDEPAKPEAKIRWKVDARDGDDLVYEVYVRRVGDPPEAWLRLDDPTEPLTKKSLTWKLDSVADGIYEVRVVASDEPANGVAKAFVDSLVGDPVVVDRARPEVAKVDVRGRSVTVRVRDATSPIAKVTYRIDEGAMHTAAPADGIVDELDETFRLVVPSEVRPGTHRLQIYVHDAAGNLTVHARTVDVP